MSDAPVPIKKLLPQHEADLRDRSGLSDETISAHGFYSESDPEAVAKLLRWKFPAKALGPCLCIPFFDPKSGTLSKYVRVKPDKPRTSKGKKGKTNKYESPIGSPNYPYFPPATIPILSDAAVELFVTEGEKKAAKATQEKFPCIGLVGVYGFQKKRPKGVSGDGPRELLDDLAAITWSGRTVYIVYDSDAAEKPEVLLAEWHLAETLTAAGANVKIIRLPAASDGSKLGLDDYLVAHGPDEFRKLIDSAQDPKKPADETPNEAPDDPHRLAAGYLETLSPNNGPLLLRAHRDEFFRWDGSYQVLPSGDLRGELAEWIRAEFLRLNKIEIQAWREKSGDDKGPLPEVRKVSTGLIGNVLLGLQGICLLSSSINAPAWIEGATGPNPTSILPVQNGLLDLNALAAGQSECLYPSTPHFFSPMVLPFEFDPKASAPTEWLAFLEKLWPKDLESVRTLQEWFGYLLTPDTRQQKILFLVGPKRSGKGTIARVLRELIGATNYVGPTLSSLSGPFGMESLLGKSVAVISDARLSGRMDSAIIVERLLAISGEDTLTIDRKHRVSVTDKLIARFVILSNELPRLGDSSGALAGRLIILRLMQSWFGKEDQKLFDRLRLELPGILLWAIEGWKRLQVRGPFVQPQTAAELVESMEDLSSPVGAFVRDDCVPGLGNEIEVVDLFKAWKEWCAAHGKKESGTDETFGRDLRAVVPGIIRTRPRNDEGKRIYTYTGIRLATPADFKPSAPLVLAGPSDHGLHAKGERNTQGDQERNGSAHRDAMPGRWDHQDRADQSKTPTCVPDREVFE